MALLPWTKRKNERIEELEEDVAELQQQRERDQIRIDILDDDVTVEHEYDARHFPDGFTEIDEPQLVWKKCRQHIVSLIIPPGETVYKSGVSKKMRCSGAYVAGVFPLHKSTRLVNFTDAFDSIRVDEKAVSLHDSRFTYESGEYVEPRLKFDMSKEACSDGIHCFRTINKAKRY